MEEQGQIVAGRSDVHQACTTGTRQYSQCSSRPTGDWLNEAIASQPLSELHRVAPQHTMILLKIEPPRLNDPVTAQILQQHRCRASSHTNEPRVTLILDFTRDLDDVLKEMPAKMRHSMRYAGRKGATLLVGG